jgi:hypothetical protein
MKQPSPTCKHHVCACAIFFPTFHVLVLRGQPRVLLLSGIALGSSCPRHRQNDDCGDCHVVYGMNGQAAAPSQLNRRFDRHDMLDLGNQHAGSSLKSNGKQLEVLREYLVFCLLRGLVLVGAKLLLYKNHGGISSKVPFRARSSSSIIVSRPTPY